MIVLIGFMGAGKSTVARLLAPRLGLPFVDTDALIVARTGASIEEIFDHGGEGAFREIEREVVGEVLAGQDAVIALGGGAVADPVTSVALEWTKVVYLEVGYAEAMRRIGVDPGRPLLTASDPRALYVARQEQYRRAADVTVDTSGKTPDEVVAEVLGALGQEATDEGVRRVVVATPSRTYSVWIGRQTIADGGELLGVPEGAEAAAVITHPSLATTAEAVSQGLARRGLRVVRLTVPEGETSKSLEQAATLYDELVAGGVHRGDLIVGVGGGVITDLTGFVAATFNRGMAFGCVPTSLLAQVDAAIGGKNGVDIAGGKNLVGTIHQPVGVVCDVDVLSSLPVEELRSGMAEVLKYGFILDPDLLDLCIADAERILGADPEVLVEIVARSAAIKAQVVAADERDGGVRAVLNYGHTFAHALENARGYGALRHGEAVALGMMTAAHLGHELGRIDEQTVEVHRRALQAFGLPTRAAMDLDSLEAAWLTDKKYRGGVRFVLLAGLGKAEDGIEATRAELERAIGRMAL